jgi:hypothetical protein
MSLVDSVDRIYLPRKIWDTIVAHCKRKLAGNFLPGESEVKRAYGILAGIQEKAELRVQLVLPVKKNARNQEPLKSYMDNVMTEHAVASTTPLSQRGWITDPEELMECYNQCDKQNLQIYGTYHMHIVPWKGDPVRDTPTMLDTVLAKDSNLFSFIISMVDVEKPSMKAFFEGNINQEVPLIITDLVEN